MNFDLIYKYKYIAICHLMYLMQVPADVINIWLCLNLRFLWVQCHPQYFPRNSSHYFLGFMTILLIAHECKNIWTGSKVVIRSTWE